MFTFSSNPPHFAFQRWFYEKDEQERSGQRHPKWFDKSLGSRSDSSFKMNNFRTIFHYLFKKIDVCIHDTVNVVSDKMHKNKVHVGDN